MSFDDPSFLFSAGLTGLMAIGAWAAKTILASRDHTIADLTTKVEARALRLETHIDAAHEAELRLTRAEEKLHGTVNRVVKTEEAIEDIRENMVRRGDLAAMGETLGQRIDDALARKPARRA